jgi:hypothetical protein
MYLYNWRTPKLAILVLASCYKYCKHMCTCMHNHKVATPNKQNKYQACCDSHFEAFHPSVASKDGMLTSEATRILQHLAGLSTDKQQSYLALN